MGVKPSHLTHLQTMFYVVKVKRWTQKSKITGCARVYARARFGGMCMGWKSGSVYWCASRVSKNSCGDAWESRRLSKGFRAVFHFSYLDRGVTVFDYQWSISSNYANSTLLFCLDLRSLNRCWSVVCKGRVKSFVAKLIIKTGYSIETKFHRILPRI